ncbi:PREDICTED: protein FAR1-RELATED SEQUENCE 5-like [Lupinus angustifolius]|uniref:protein FAR1-RELATED SEQUENCE 5-like n=1 Tax=Lupinus angustifolius TaxID=3871 RepID=UPI00092EA6A1|nr:PREDICTED: protein FAR1-RELATED SEQUENCE 5-like [Lupinus angustifolius]
MDEEVSNETEETYVWLLEKFLEVVNGKQPKCVIIDGDLAMRNAIQRVFPEAHHRLCAWRCGMQSKEFFPKLMLCNNAGKNIKRKNFHKDFQKVMYADVEVEDFQLMWEEVIIKHELQNNAWAAQTYDCRSMWVRSYVRGNFYAGLHTTSRCKGLHSQMGRYIESGYNVTDFLYHFQQCVSHVRNNEVVEDFKSSYGDKLLQTPYHNLEGYAATIYTKAVYKEFHEVLLEVSKMKIISTHKISTNVIYKVGKHYSPNRKWHVSHYDGGSNVDIKCSCRRMEFFRMPCSHIIFVLLILDMPQLPSCLVLKRWTKKAKDAHRINFEQCDLSQESVQSSRYGALSDDCRVLCNLACKTEEDFKEMLEKVYNECIRLRLKQNSSSLENDVNGNEDQVKDPVRVRPKGRVHGTSSRGMFGTYQARILWIIGGELIPDKSNSRATKPNARAMGGFLLLLQSWAWYRLPFIAPRVNNIPTYPLASRWGLRNCIFTGVPRGDLTVFSSRIDQMDANEVTF